MFVKITIKPGQIAVFNGTQYACDFRYTKRERRNYGTEEVCGALPFAHLEATGDTNDDAPIELVINDRGQLCKVWGRGYVAVGFASDLLAF